MCEAASFRALPLARWKRGVDITSPLPQPRHRATPLTVAREPRITYDIDPKWRLSQRSMTESWGRAEGGRGGEEEREEEGIFFFLFFLFFIVPISFDLSDCYPPCSWGCSIQPPSPLAAPTAFLYVVTVTRWESHQRLADIKPQLADTTFPDH